MIGRQFILCFERFRIFNQEAVGQRSVRSACHIVQGQAVTAIGCVVFFQCIQRCPVALCVHAGEPVRLLVLSEKPVPFQKECVCTVRRKSGFCVFRENIILKCFFSDIFFQEDAGILECDLFLQGDARQDQCVGRYEHDGACHRRQDDPPSALAADLLQYFSDFCPILHAAPLFIRSLLQRLFCASGSYFPALIYRILLHGLFYRFLLPGLFYRFLLSILFCRFLLHGPFLDG